MNNKIKEILSENLEGIPVIDTHEHLVGSSAKRVPQSDLFSEYLNIDYLGRDLLSAGMSKKEMAFLISPDHSVMEKWKVFSKYWRYCRFTGYGRAMDISARGLYGLDGINEKTVEELNAAVMHSFERNHYKTVLHDKCHIKTALVDNSDLESDKTYFRCMFRIDHLIYPLEEAEFVRVETELGRPICCLDDWLEACVLTLRNALASGAVGFKLAVAYRRSLNFDRSTYGEAENDFKELIRFKSGLEWLPHPIHVGPAFSDYVLHYVLREIQRLRAPLQIHTGHIDGNCGLIEKADPVLLNNLFVEYPDIRFDLFHMGFPYQEKMLSLVKIFPNVYFDFCWAHILAPESSKIMLKKCLTTLPINKISVFGGDHGAVDLVYGHLWMAKDHVSSVLADCIENNFMDMDAALWIANRLFYENPVELYGLNLNEVEPKEYGVY